VLVNALGSVNEKLQSLTVGINPNRDMFNIKALSRLEHFHSQTGTLVQLANLHFAFHLLRLSIRMLTITCIHCPTHRR
jgi:hypothetical protein